MSKLIAFYSRAGENYFSGSLINIEIGNTEKVAKIIASIICADLFKIEQENPYSNNYNVCIDEAKKDLYLNARPKILNIRSDILKYDEIYLGYPNYFGTMPMAVYTFLEKFDFKGKKIYPFCTHEGSGMSNTEKDIAKTANGVKVEKGLAIHGSFVDKSECIIKNWCKKEIYE